MSLIFFVGPNLAKNIPAVTKDATIYDYIGQHNLNLLFINPVNEAEVIGIITLCKPKDSMDYDDISVRDGRSRYRDERLIVLSHVI